MTMLLLELYVMKKLKEQKIKRTTKDTDTTNTYLKSLFAVEPLLLGRL